eukprot:358413-Chlamydomonas_euryale.AAC.23
MRTAGHDTHAMRTAGRDKLGALRVTLARVIAAKKHGLLLGRGRWIAPPPPFCSYWKKSPWQGQAPASSTHQPHQPHGVTMAAASTATSGNTNSASSGSGLAAGGAAVGASVLSGLVPGSTWLMGGHVGAQRLSSDALTALPSQPRKTRGHMANCAATLYEQQARVKTDRHSRRARPQRQADNKPCRATAMPPYRASTQHAGATAPPAPTCWMRQSDSTQSDGVSSTALWPAATLRRNSGGDSCTLRPTVVVAMLLLLAAPGHSASSRSAMTCSSWRHMTCRRKKQLAKRALVARVG